MRHITLLIAIMFRLIPLPKISIAITCMGITFPIWSYVVMSCSMERAAIKPFLILFKLLILYLTLKSYVECKCSTV